MKYTSTAEDREYEVREVNGGLFAVRVNREKIGYSRSLLEAMRVAKDYEQFHAAFFVE